MHPELALGAVSPAPPFYPIEYRAMNDQEFELCLLTLGLFDFKAAVEGLRIRDTAQREALARVEAERDLAVSQRDGNLFAAQQMTEAAEEAQAQLAEAVALLQEIEQRMYGEDVEHRFTDLIADIDRITAQAENRPERAFRVRSRR